MTTDTAIFIDLDNLVIGANEANLTFDTNLILQHVRKLTDGSRVVIRRAYGDWRQNSQIPRQLAVNGFELQSVVRINSNDKNLADIQMVLDAAETIIDNDTIQTYVLATGDRDFMPLVQMLRRRGKNVIGLGIRHTTSNSLVDLCDQYVFYDDLAQSHEKDDQELLETWIRKASDHVFAQHEKIQASIFRDEVQKCSDDKFDKTKLARTSFSKLLARFPNIVQLERLGTTLYVTPPHKPLSEADGLAAKYRSELKKCGLRVVPADIRLLVLKDSVAYLHQFDSPRWLQIVDYLSSHYAELNQTVSRSMINDVLRLARRAKIIWIDEQPEQALSSTNIHLVHKGERSFQNAVISADRTYLAELQKMKDIQFDWREAALALYDSAEKVPYLQYICRDKVSVA